MAPAQIAKTLSLRLKDEVILLVVGGDARIDNRKYKDRFGGKAVMLPAEDVLQWTGHPVGGVCPFGLPRAIRVFADVTLRTFDVVLPAAGAPNAALRIPDRPCPAGCTRARRVGRCGPVKARRLIPVQANRVQVRGAGVPRPT